MKRRVVILLLILVLTTVVSSAQTYEGVWTETRTVTYSSGEKTISIVWADLNDDQIRIDTVLANNDVGQVNSLGGVVESATDSDGVAVAGINGSFFQAYDDLQPLGYLTVDGETVHINESGSILTIDGDNNFDVGTITVDINGSTSDQWEWPYSWYAWMINHYDSTNEGAIMVFNSYYDGPIPDHDFTTITVKSGVVTDISVGVFDIPIEGFLILTKTESVIDTFEVGETCDYRLDYFVEAETDIDVNGVRTAVGAGPTLVKDGEIVLDAASEGFAEEKILTEAAQRSLVGVTSEGYLGMASISGVTLSELGEIAIDLGMVQAINLDGGASSGVYYDDGYIVEPGREISNALVVSRLYKNPISVTLNGEEIFFDADPYLNTTYNRTLVPLRKIAEALGATVGWDSTTSSVTIKRYDTEIKLQAGNTTVYVNDEAVEMEVPLTIRESRSYVPVRFVTELFGGDVGWDGETKTVSLLIDDSEIILEQAASYVEAQDYELAISKYIEVLEIDQDNLTAIKELAYIYNIILGDKAAAIDYYERAYLLDETDSASLNYLAWAHYSLSQLEDAIYWFDIYGTDFSDAPTGYYGLGLCYSSYTYQEVDRAIEYFELAIDKGLSGSSLTYAKAYIEENE